MKKCGLCGAFAPWHLLYYYNLLTYASIFLQFIEKTLHHKPVIGNSENNFFIVNMHKSHTWSTFPALKIWKLQLKNASFFLHQKNVCANCTKILTVYHF
jgi:hypothetical protein